MRSLFAAVLIVMPIAGFADETAIRVDHAWSRAEMAGHEGVVYLTITDAAERDILTGVTTPVATKAELHQSIDESRSASRRPVR
jgi:copper(I)-binding protein